MHTRGRRRECASGTRSGRAVSVEFCGLTLAHPVINGSGTFDAIAARRAFGEELDERFPFAAFVSKTITLRPREGNPPPRLWETPAGLINSIGLPNRGLDGYLAEDLPRLAWLGVPLITNVMGSTAAELARLVGACDGREEITAIELNVSCPNVRTGLDIGADPGQLEMVVREVRPHTRKPLIVKLTPNTADVAACAWAAQEGGADAVSLINTLRAMALAPRPCTPPASVSCTVKPAASVAPAAPAARAAPAAAEAAVVAGESAAGPRRRWLGGGVGGLSGPAVRAVALAQVAAVAARVEIPVIGMGGVQSAAHARDLLDVGATLVAVGSESFRDPLVGARIAHDLAARAA
jgi:dihydroorotate dehydrogenase (NAD+) catalytic subunit